MNHRASSRNQRGFSLIEVMVAIMLMTFGLLAFASMQGVAINHNVIGNRISASATVAQMVTDDLLSVPIVRTPVNNTWYTKFMTANTYPYDRFPPFDGQSNVTPVNFYDVPGAGRFTAEYSVVAPAAGTSIAQVQVTVSLNGTPVPGLYVGDRLIP